LAKSADRIEGATMSGRCTALSRVAARLTRRWRGGNGGAFARNARLGLIQDA
jgi:hypothetical protein